MPRPFIVILIFYGIKNIQLIVFRSDKVYLVDLASFSSLLGINVFLFLCGYSFFPFLIFTLFQINSLVILTSSFLNLHTESSTIATKES